MKLASLGIAIVLVFAAALPSCKNREQRRLDLTNYVTSKDPAERSRAKEGFKKLVAEDPDDLKARQWLALMYLQDGEIELCKAEYREVIARGKNPQEVAEAKDHLAKVEAKYAPNASASTTAAPLPAIPIMLGRSAGGVSIGQSFAEMEAALGKCTISMEAPPARVCAYPERGLDVGLREGKVVRLGLYRDNRLVPTADFQDRYYSTYRGASSEGVALGITREELVRLLGEPPVKQRPFGEGSNRDGSFRMEVVTYPERGVSFELDVSKEGIRVGAIHLPRLETPLKKK